MKDLLGGKGAGLAEMTHIGLPVPAGFTITTEACDYYFKHGKKYPRELADLVRANLARLERVTGKKLGDGKNPLLVSVRSGSARSMPGMMETILNLGLNEKSVEALARNTKNERFAYDAYRRFVQMYSSVVIGLPKEELEAKLRAMKDRLKVKDDTEVSAAGWRDLVKEYKAVFPQQDGTAISPRTPWNSSGARLARSSVPGWPKKRSPTAASKRSRASSARPSTSCRWSSATWATIPAPASASRATPTPARTSFYGDYLINAQGEDVVAGIRTPMKLAEFGKAHAQASTSSSSVRAHPRKALQGHAGPGIHRRGRQAVHAAVPHRQAYARGRIQDRRGHGQRRPHHQGRSARCASSPRTSRALLSRSSILGVASRRVEAASSWPAASTPFPAPPPAKRSSPRMKPRSWRQGGRRSSWSARKPAPKTSAACTRPRASSPRPAARPATRPSSPAAGASAASSAARC